MKKILITGSSGGGLGFAAAKKIAAQFGGDCLIILHCNKNVDSANVNAETLRKGYGCQVKIEKCDLSNIKETEKFAKRVSKDYGVIDVLINNAAMVVDTPLEERTPEIFEQTLRCNLIAPFILSKELGLKMQERGCGKIINISSTNGIDYNSPYSLDYDASKAGLISLTKNFAMEMNKVNVNCVCPHWMNTQMNADLDEEFLQEETSKIIKGRFAEPSEVAELIWFLISDKSDYLTGQVYSFGSYHY